MTPAIRYLTIFTDVRLPERSTAGAAGYDVRAHLRGRVLKYYPANNQDCTLALLGAEDWFELAPQDRVLVPLGFRAQLPAGFVAQVVSRSGLALKQGLVVANAPGIIDEDYLGEWGVVLQNTSAVPVRITHDDRIAQVVLLPYAVLPFESLDAEPAATGRDASGFGSSGVS